MSCVVILFSIMIMISIFGSLVTHVLMFLLILFVRTCLTALLRGAKQLTTRTNR